MRSEQHARNMMMIAVKNCVREDRRSAVNRRRRRMLIRAQTHIKSVKKNQFPAVIYKRLKIFLVRAWTRFFCVRWLARFL